MPKVTKARAFGAFFFKFEQMNRDDQKKGGEGDGVSSFSFKKFRSSH